MMFLLVCSLLVLGVLVGLALSQVSGLRKRVNALMHELFKLPGLESRLKLLERELEGLRGGAKPSHQQQSPVSTVPIPAASPADAPPPVFDPKVVPADKPLTTPADAAGMMEIPSPAVPRFEYQPPKPSRSRAEWESFVGGQLLNRIGAFALIIGVGFFLKYAFDNNWISESVRVLIGAAAGVSCLAVAARTRGRGMMIFAQGLVGGGVAILYLSVFASFNYYHLVPQWVAFVLMSAVTLVTFVHGVRYDSLAVAALGWAGGFLTPFMLSSGTPNAVGLFGYIAILDVAILGLLFRKREWVVLEPLTMLATWTVYYAWHLDLYDESRLGTSLSFTGLFWLLFHLSDSLRGARGTSPRSAARYLAPAANAGLFYLMLYAILESGHHGWTAPATLILAALYFFTGLTVRGMEGGSLGVAESGLPQHLLTTAVLVGVATAIEYSGFSTILLWALEGAALAWCGARWNFRYLLSAGVVFLAAAALKLTDTPGAFFHAYPGETDPVLNLRSLAYLAYCASLALAARQYRNYDDRIAALLRAWLESASALALFVLVTVSVNDFFSFRQSLEPPGAAHDLIFRRLMAIGSSWTIFSLPFVAAGLSAGRATALISGLVALLLGVALVVLRGIAFHPIEIFAPLFNYRVAAFLLAALTLVIHSTLLYSRPDPFGWLPDVRDAIRLAIGVAILALLTGETRDTFGRMLHDLGPGGSSGPDADTFLKYRNLQQLSLSGVWLLYSGILLAAGIWKKSRGLRLFSIGLFGLTILKIFIYDLSFLETLYRIFSFVGLGLILLAVSYAYQRFKGLLFGPGDPPAGGTGGS